MDAVSKSMDKDVSSYVKGFLAYVNMINPDQAVVLGRLLDGTGMSPG